MKHLLTLFLLLPFTLLQAQYSQPLTRIDIESYEIPSRVIFQPTAQKKFHLFKGIKYEWNTQKTIGLGLLILASLADGVCEAMEFDNRMNFEWKYGVSPTSFAGSESWRRAYKNYDPAQGHKNLWTKHMGAFDLYHALDDGRKLGYISGSICFTIGAKDQDWRGIFIDVVGGLAVTSIAKKTAIDWTRQKP